MREQRDDHVPARYISLSELIEGAPPTRPQKVEEDHTGMVRCTNYGCYKWYKPEENSDTACHYHTSPPVFHDASKGWSCCQKCVLGRIVRRRRVYDWDEFYKIEGCTIGPHCCDQKMQSFAPSPTVAAINAAVAASSAPAPSAAAPSAPTPSAAAPSTAAPSTAAPSAAAPVIKSIEEFNRTNANAPTTLRSAIEAGKSKPTPVEMKGRNDGERAW